MDERDWVTGQIVRQGGWVRLSWVRGAWVLRRIESRRMDAENISGVEMGSGWAWVD